MIYQRGHLARPLDAVLGHASRLAALRALFAAPDGLSGRQVARRAGINHQAAALALRALEAAGLVSHRDYERSIHWRLERGRFLVEEGLLSLLETEARHADEVVGTVKDRIGRKADFVIIVGECALGRLAAAKPLEIAFLCEAGRRRPLIAALHELDAELFERFGLRLKADVLTRGQALTRLDLLDGWQLLPTEGRPAPFSAAR